MSAWDGCVGRRNTFATMRALRISGESLPGKSTMTMSYWLLRFRRVSARRPVFFIVRIGVSPASSRSSDHLDTVKTLGSASTMTTCFPCDCQVVARLTVRVDFPTPPFWLPITTIMRLASLI